MAALALGKSQWCSMLMVEGENISLFFNDFISLFLRKNKTKQIKKQFCIMS